MADFSSRVPGRSTVRMGEVPQDPADDDRLMSDSNMTPREYFDTVSEMKTRVEVDDAGNEYRYHMDPNPLRGRGAEKFAGSLARLIAHMPR